MGGGIHLQMFKFMRSRPQRPNRPNSLGVDLVLTKSLNKRPKQAGSCPDNDVFGLNYLVTWNFKRFEAIFLWLVCRNGFCGSGEKEWCFKEDYFCCLSYGGMYYNNQDIPEFQQPEPRITHVLVTGGAGYIGSHAALRLLKDSHRVTIVDNLSRGNIGAVTVLQNLFPEPGRLQFIYADLGDPKSVNKIFSENAFDAVMHFAAVAYVGESTLDPLKYYHNITSNTLVVLEAMAAHNVNTLIYSSTCATYGEPEKMPIIEETPQHPINPYGKAKKMAEDIILDVHKNSDMAVMILRYFNVIGSDPDGRLGEAPRPELREHGRISAACFDAARGITNGLKVRGTDYKTADGTCVRDYIDVTDLVDAHVKALEKAQPGEVGIYNVGTGRGRSVKEFVEACKKATGVSIKVDYLPRRPGDYAEVFSDPSKILRELNWSAKYMDLEKSLRVAWKWQKLHHNGYGPSKALL